MSRRILIATMRNEAPFILEWLAYHRVIGFDAAIIWSNDSDDGTTALLNRLDEAGVIAHRHWSPDAERPIVDQLAEDAAQARLFEDGDWVMWLDADEFLNIHVGEGRLDDLIAALGDHRGICATWRLSLIHI